MKNLKAVTLLAVIVALQFVVTTPTAWAQQAHVDKTVASAGAADTQPVAWDTFVQAETDKYMKSYADLGGFGKFFNIRKPTPVDKQKVIRMNRDTMYSFGVFDLTTPVTITKPDTDGRFQSMQVINGNGYTPMVVYKPGRYTLSQESVGTRFVFVGVFLPLKAREPFNEILQILKMQTNRWERNTIAGGRDSLHGQVRCSTSGSSLTCTL